MPKLKQYRLLAARPAAAAVLAVSMAAFGCTTNNTAGNGDPVTAPGAGVPAPASAPNTGSAGGTNPGTQAMDRLVTTREEAMQIMAQHQSPRGVVLGPVDPVPTVFRGAEAPPTGQFGWPALATNPQITVNSSISSPPVPAISSGAGEPVGGGPAIASGLNAMTMGGTAAGATAPASGAVFAPMTTTPTAAAIPVAPGAFAGTTTVLTPAASPALTGTTVAAAGTPTPTMSVAGLPPTTAASAATAATTTTATSAAPFGGRAALLARTASASAPLRVVTDRTGSVVVTNQARSSRTAATRQR